MSFGNASGDPGAPSPLGAVGPGGRINPAIVQLVMLVAIPFCLSSQDGNRYLIAIVACGILSGLVGFAPAVGLVAMFVYLTLESGARRWLLPVFGYSSNDPFLLVVPLVVAINFANLVIARRIPRESKISNLVFWFLVIMMLQILNPLQGGLIVGLAGALFYIVPVLWFYLGRMYATEENYNRYISASIVVIILVTVYGMYQTYFGMLPVEVEFLRYAGFMQTIEAGVRRTFSTLASPAEYAALLSIGSVLCVTRILNKRYIYLFILAGLVVALFLTSIRGTFVAFLMTSAILITIQGREMRRWLPRLIATLLIGSIGLVWSLQKIQTSASTDASSTGALQTHMTSGLLDPLHSTAQAHSSLQIFGILGGITHPLGMGLGATTLAASKYGSTGAAAEGDFGNMFISLGVLGGVIFTMIVYHTMREATLHWHRSRTLTALTAMAILLVAFNVWMVGGNYSVVMLVWVAIGYIDRVSLKHKLETEATEDNSQPRRQLPGAPKARGNRRIA